MGIAAAFTGLKVSYHTKHFVTIQSSEATLLKYLLVLISPLSLFQAFNALVIELA